MKKLIVAVIVLMVISISNIFAAAGAQPTATPVIKADAEMIKIAVKYNVEKGKQKLKLDEETTKVQPLINVASYIYNNDYTAVVVIYTLDKENEQKFRNVVSAKGNIIKSNEIDKEGKDFKGLIEGIK